MSVLVSDRTESKFEAITYSIELHDMLIDLAHDRIIYLGMSYIERGWITQDEYENLHDYLYKPYEEMGGNGSAKKVMQEINKLPIHKSTYIQENQ